MGLKVVISVATVVVLCLHVPLLSRAEENYRHDFVCPQVKDTVSGERFRLYYGCDESTVVGNYLDNEAQIERIMQYLSKSPRIDSIVIYSYVSPEGSFRRNAELSLRRAQAARDFILGHSQGRTDLRSDNIRLHPMNENWEGLGAAVKEKYDGADRDEVLSIIYDPKLSPQARKNRLMALDGGRTWKTLKDKYMPPLRYATWVCHWEDPAPEYEPIDSVGGGYQDYRLRTPDDSLLRVKYDRAPNRGLTLLALKTNLLYDVASIVNFDVEFAINRHFSLMYEHHCPWWLTRSNRYCLQLLSMGGEFRWWFIPRNLDWNHPDVLSGRFRERDALSGHFLGLYASGGMFDIQARTKGCYQGEYFSAGLTYGFAFPVSQYLNVEVSLSAGYARIPYRHYNPSDDWEMLIRDRSKEGVLHWWGPTKVKVSLVLPIRLRLKHERALTTGTNVLRLTPARKEKEVDYEM